MKIFRFGGIHEEHPGVIAPDGSPRDVSGLILDWEGSYLHPDWLSAFENHLVVDYKSLPIIDLTSVRIAPPVRPMQLLSVGMNYQSHIAQVGLDSQLELIIAGKSILAVCGPNDELPIPPAAQKVDWEVELAVVVGKRTQYLKSVQEARNSIAGYCIGNDISDREWLLERGGEWIKGKSFENFAPLGPFLVTPSSFSHDGNVRMTCSVNGAPMQSGTTAEMRYTAPEIIRYISQFMILMPGDVILTGSPAGSALGSSPRKSYLKTGDIVEAAIDGLGQQRQVCCVAMSE